MVSSLTAFSRRALGYTSMVVASNAFLWFVLAAFVIQAAWIAISFRFPMVFDERYHLGIIQYFSSHPNLFSTHQSPQYDLYGNIAYGNASLYHYIMAVPYELIRLFIKSFQAQIVVLRLLNVVMVAVGLLLFNRVLVRIWPSRALANLTIFFFSLVPLFLLVSATISYDNMLFPLTALFLLCGIRVLQSGSDNIVAYLEFVVVGLLASLVKFTFLPVFAAGVLFLGVWWYRRRLKMRSRKNGTKFPFRPSGLYPVTLCAAAAVLMVLFAARYVVPLAEYHTPIPDCAKVLNASRCQNSWNYKVAEQALASKGSRLPDLIGTYAEKWAQMIVLQLDTSGSSINDSDFRFGEALPLLSLLIFLSVYGGIVVLLYMWRSLPDKPVAWYFASAMAAAVVVSVFLYNAYTYYTYNEDLNVQSRYLLSAIPIILFMAIIGINHALKGRSVAKLLVVVGVLTLCTQGAGDVKHIVTSSDNWYWHSPAIIRMNEALRNGLKPLVKELP
jgi:hypothetical protein